MTNMVSPVLLLVAVLFVGAHVGADEGGDDEVEKKVPCSSMNDQKECNAMHDFFHGVHKEDGSPLEWPFDGSNMCMWAGVACKMAGEQMHVSKLDLHDHKLRGTIPDSIGDLKNLQRAYLTSNKFHGTLPRTVTGIESLQYLDLAHNQMTGPIPDHIGDLQNLQWLYLNSNKFTGTIPADISRLSKLWNLSLQYNELSGPIPEGFGAGLQKLEHLTLHANKLDAIPESFCEVVPHLVECRLQSNMWPCPRGDDSTLQMPTCATDGKKCDACQDMAKEPTGMPSGTTPPKPHDEL